MNSEIRNLPPLSLRAAVEPSTLDRKARTVELTWTAGARVLRGWWDQFWEELSLDPSHVHLERLNNGAPFLANHDGYSVVDTPGVVERAWLAKAEDGAPVGRALVRFTREGVDPDADKLFEKIADRIVTNVSVGYRVHRFEKVSEDEDKVPVLRATSWTPHEISAVAIGADDAAGFRSQERSGNSTPNAVEIISNPSHMERTNMDKDETTKTPEQIRALERERVNGITALVRKHAARIPALEAIGQRLISEEKSLDVARERILDEVARWSDEQAPSPVPSGAVERSHSGADNRVRSMAEALAYRAGARAELSTDAKPYRALSMLDMARICLEARGVSPRLMGKDQLLRAAFHTTSDFKTLLTEAGRRVLLDGYNAAPAGIRGISKRTSASDFRAKQLLRVGEAPQLLKVPEHGEVKRGTMATTAEGYKLETYARIFSLTRQGIINDDLGVFSDLVRKFGLAAAELEAAILVELLTSNPTLADGIALFHGSRGNLAAAGSEITIDSLGEGVAAMATMKSLDGKTVLNVVPRFLVVPAALAVKAHQITAQVNATQSSDVNPFGSSMRLTPVVEPRLDAISKTAWYLASDPNVTPGLEHAYLDGQEGPEIVESEGFEVMGTEWRASLDFGAGAVGYEGLYRNPGQP